MTVYLCRVKLHVFQRRTINTAI